MKTHSSRLFAWRGLGVGGGAWGRGDTWILFQTLHSTLVTESAPHPCNHPCVSPTRGLGAGSSSRLRSVAFWGQLEMGPRNGLSAGFPPPQEPRKLLPAQAPGFSYIPLVPKLPNSVSFCFQRCPIAHVPPGGQWCEAKNTSLVEETRGLVHLIYPLPPRDARRV